MEMASLAKAEYPVLADPAERVARDYGVFELLGDGVAAPATFIVGKDGAIVWSQVGKTINDRPTADEIIQRLDAL